MFALVFMYSLVSVLDIGLCADPEAAFYLTTKTANISLNSTENLKHLNLEWPTKFIIHGWTEDANHPDYVQMVHEFLKKGNFNMIRVDYSNSSKLDFIRAYLKVENVGIFVGKFIANLNITHNVPMEKVHVVGHSLGGQVGAYAGRTVLEETNFKIGRITALDPARPGFESEMVPKNRKLTNESAEMVDIIHTDGGQLGYGLAAGTVDFFPNGGKKLQPGCTNGNVSMGYIFDTILNRFNYLFSDDYCSHQKSKPYFIKSINGNYSATKCESRESFEAGKCAGNEQIPFGDNAPASARGSFYLHIDTNN